MPQIQNPPQNIVLTELVDGTIEISFSSQRKLKISPPRLLDFTSQFPSELGNLEHQKPSLPRISSESEIGRTQESPSGILRPIYKPQNPSSPTPSYMGYSVCVIEQSKTEIVK